MQVDWSLIPVAFAGGLLGAAFGGLAAFILTGVFVLIGVAIAAAGGGKDFIANVAFGPMLGPHVSFAAGVAAAAYAAKVGTLPTGRDIATGLVGSKRADVLIVGGLFGVFGFLIQAFIGPTPAGQLTDSIALTVFVSAVIARLAFGKSGLFGREAFANDWAPYQSGWAYLVTLGGGLGLGSAALVRAIGADKGGDVAGFGMAATGLIFGHICNTVPVWHHIALPAAIATVGAGGNLWAGAAAGAAGAVLGKIYSRIFQDRGDTHVDPPAATIATLTLALRLIL